MRTTLAVALGGGLLAVLLSVPGLSDHVRDTWKTDAGDDGIYADVRISECGATTVVLCSVPRMPRTGRSRRTPWASAWSEEGSGAYASGRIWAPDRDKIHRSKIQLSRTSLNVSGCVGPFCSGQQWPRVN